MPTEGEKTKIKRKAGTTNVGVPAIFFIYLVLSIAFVDPETNEIYRYF